MRPKLVINQMMALIFKNLGCNLICNSKTLSCNWKNLVVSTIKIYEIQLQPNLKRKKNNNWIPSSQLVTHRTHESWCKANGVGFD
jgi:hypothetical protein